MKPEVLNVLESDALASVIGKGLAYIVAQTNTISDDKIVAKASQIFNEAMAGTPTIDDLIKSAVELARTIVNETPTHIDNAVIDALIKVEATLSEDGDYLNVSIGDAAAIATILFAFVVDIKGE